jgi:type VII secretion protein EccB
MQSQRDVFQAYRYLVRRAQAALITGEPDVVEPPMRRLTASTLSGIMVGVLAVAAFGLIGLIRPGNGADWKAAGTVIVERETGARYVYLGGQLHPVLNYTSALLAAATNGSANVVLVRRSALAKTPRGVAIGVPGLPDSLPGATSLVGPPWSSCSRLQKASTGARTHVTVDLGDAVPGRPVSPSTGVMVQTPDGTQYLLYGGRRLAVADKTVRSELQLDTVSALTVGRAFVDAIPVGPSLGAPALPDAGTVSPLAIGGQAQPIGRVLKLADGTYRLVLRDGVAPISGVEALLLERLDLGTGPQVPLDVTASDLASLPQSQAWTRDPLVRIFAGLPSAPPKLDAAAATSDGVCVVYAAGRGASFEVLTQQAPANPGQITDTAAGAANLADEVVVRGGSAAFVRPDNGAVTNYLIASGTRYPVSAAAAAALGYGKQKPDSIPQWLLVTIPAGTALDPQAARCPAVAAASSNAPANGSQRSAVCG